MKAVIAIIRGKRDKVIYNSGVIRLHHQSSVNLFKRRLKGKAEVIVIEDLSKHVEPEDRDFIYRTSKYFCTTCGCYERFINKDDKKVCPVCGISTRDYWIKTINRLWPTMGGK